MLSLTYLIPMREGLVVCLFVGLLEVGVWSKSVVESLLNLDQHDALLVFSVIFYPLINDSMIITMIMSIHNIARSLLVFSCQLWLLCCYGVLC